MYGLDATLVPAIAEAVRTDRASAFTLRLDEARYGEQSIVFGDETPAADDPVDLASRSLLELGESGIVETAEGDLVFVEAFAPRANMYIFGASDHVAALVPHGEALGYRVSVCDPRRVFLTEARFPDADELVDEWPGPVPRARPDRLPYGDPDDDARPEIRRARAQARAGVGRGLHRRDRKREDPERRNARLRAEGIGEADLARLHAPVGIQIGARTPEEVAVTIAAS